MKEYTFEWFQIFLILLYQQQGHVVHEPFHEDLILQYRLQHVIQEEQLKIYGIHLFPNAE